MRHPNLGIIILNNHNLLFNIFLKHSELLIAEFCRYCICNHIPELNLFAGKWHRVMQQKQSESG